MLTKENIDCFEDTDKRNIWNNSKILCKSLGEYNYLEFGLLTKLPLGDTLYIPSRSMRDQLTSKVVPRYTVTVPSSLVLTPVQTDESTYCKLCINVSCFFLLCCIILSTPLKMNYNSLTFKVIQHGPEIL